MTDLSYYVVYNELLTQNCVLLKTGPKQFQEIRTHREWLTLAAPKRPQQLTAPVLQNFGVLLQIVGTNGRRLSPDCFYLTDRWLFLEKPIAVQLKSETQYYSDTLEIICRRPAYPSPILQAPEASFYRYENGVRLYTGENSRPKDYAYATLTADQRCLFFSSLPSSPPSLPEIITDLPKLTAFLQFFFSLEDALTLCRTPFLTETACDFETVTSSEAALRYVQESHSAGFSVFYACRHAYEISKNGWFDLRLNSRQLQSCRRQPLQNFRILDIDQDCDQVRQQLEKFEYTPLQSSSAGHEHWLLTAETLQRIRPSLAQAKVLLNFNDEQLMCLPGSLSRFKSPQYWDWTQQCEEV
jgi:hypothetical protein